MALTSINKKFTKKTRDVNLLAKDFSSFKQRLTDFSKTYFPNTYNDFSESSVGNMFIELSSYVGDVLSYSIDYNFKESLLSQATDEKNVIRLAQSLGYNVPLASSAITSIEVYQLLPNNGSNQPDWTYALEVNSNMKIRSTLNSNIQFRTNEPIDFSDMQSMENVNNYISVYQESGGTPTFYLIKYYKEVSVVSGIEKQVDVSVGEPQPYYKIQLQDENIIDIISVVDADGNKYYEVDYLAQDSVLLDTELVNRNTQPFIQPRLVKAPRRFVTRINKNLRKEIQFGSGVTADLDEDTIVSLTQAFNRTDSADLNIDPVSFSQSNTYGKVPSNTTITITYTVGVGSDANVGQGDLTDIYEVSFSNQLTNLNTSQRSTLNQIQQTLTVTNPSAATGARGGLTVDEIRQNALQFFSSQKRCVTALDYKARIFSLPQRYGSITKAHVTRHNSVGTNLSNAPTIDAFLLSYDANQNLTQCNSQLKKNLSVYLNQFRMLTDGINILDGYIINIGVDFEISVYASFNKNEVLLQAIEAVKDFFSVDKMDFNQPIYLNDLELEIGNVSGVRTVHSVTISNKSNSNYSAVVYPIASATRDKIIYPSVEPSVFEVKFPNTDIKGKVK